MTKHYKTDEEVLEDFQKQYVEYPHRWFSEGRNKTLENYILSLRSSDKEALLGVIEGWVESKKEDIGLADDWWGKGFNSCLDSLATFLQGLRNKTVVDQAIEYVEENFGESLRKLGEK